MFDGCLNVSCLYQLIKSSPGADHGAGDIKTKIKSTDSYMNLKCLGDLDNAYYIDCIFLTFGDDKL